MLSSNYRLRLEYICKRIADGHEVQLEDMIWADKLAKANRSAGEMLRKARRTANNPNMQDGDLDDFLNKMDLGDPDPQRHKKGFDSVEQIVEWFHDEKPQDWRQRDQSQSVMGPPCSQASQVLAAAHLNLNS